MLEAGYGPVPGCVFRHILFSGCLYREPAVTIANADTTERLLLKITTTSDFKQVVRIDQERQKMQDMNVGTLIDPQVIQGFVTVDTSVCITRAR